MWKTGSKAKGETEMPRYRVTLTKEEKEELEQLVQRGGKGYQIKHAQILLKLDRRSENRIWTYDRTVRHGLRLQAWQSGLSWKAWKQPWDVKYRKIAPEK